MHVLPIGDHGRTEEVREEVDYRHASHKKYPFNSSPRFKSFIQKFLFILNMHGDYVFILIVYSWPLAGKVT